MRFKWTRRGKKQKWDGRATNGVYIAEALIRPYRLGYWVSMSLCDLQGRVITTAATSGANWIQARQRGAELLEMCLATARKTVRDAT